MIRLAIRVHREQAELVLAELLSLAPSGVEEVDVSPGLVEYAVYGPPGELPDLPDVRAAVGGALVEVTSAEVADDWAERWREFHRPLVLPGLVVRPPWEPAPEAGEVIDLVIDPGRAFGTGAHATTRLCLELLLGLERPPAFEATGLGSAPAVVDLGCGSGVLGIAAARLGWAPALALDFDPLAIGATCENARVNGASESELRVERFDLRSDPVPAAPLVLANLLAPLLLAWCSRMTEPPPGQVIASGLLVGEADRVAAAFAAVGLSEVERRERGEWAALLLRVA